MPGFMILMQEDDHAWSRLGPEEQQRLLGEYSRWAEELREKEILKGGAALSDGGRFLESTADGIVTTPFTETNQVPTGFFLIEAPDLDAATEIAKGCPALTHGETVVVRRTGHGSGD